MQAGKLRHRIEIQEQISKTQGSSGKVTATWETTSTVWGSVSPLSGRELFQAQQVRPDVTHQVVIRGKVTLTPKQRLKLGDRILHIEAVFDIDERRIEKRVLCTEKINLPAGEV